MTFNSQKVSLPFFCRPLDILDSLLCSLFLHFGGFLTRDIYRDIDKSIIFSKRRRGQVLHVTQMAQEYQELVIFQVLLVEKDIIQNNFKLFARQRPTNDKKS